MPAFEDPALRDLQRVRAERDLFRNLLRLGATSDLQAFLDEAIGLVTEVAQAWQGYIEICDPEAESIRSWAALGCSRTDVDAIRVRISRGIIAEAIATGKTVSTDSAFLDERFATRESVQRSQIGAVLCTPIGSPIALGVVYLQGRTDGGVFGEEDRERVTLIADHLAPFAIALIERERRAAPDPLSPLRTRYKLDGLIGRSQALARAVEDAMLAAPLDVTVLLLGDSGTGKSQLARAIHANSARAHAPFVEINCAAIPATLVESELFGALAGAHSQARQAMPGKVQAAEGGTLFLDEIAELPLEAQAKLLQILQSREYYPLGSPTPRRADVRLIAASNTDLEQAAAERRFRPDLLYRLQVLIVRMPGLAERREDLPDLARALCDRACRRHGLPAIQPGPTALRLLEARTWPGHVRQLENAIEAGVVRAASRGSSTLEPAHLFPGEVSEPDAGGPVTFQEATRRFQRDLVRSTLEASHWNVAEAARRLDLARSHVYNLIEAFGLRDRPKR